MVAGRDYDLREVMKGFAGCKVAPVSMPAEAPLFLMYTSGTTGQPKGCQHSTGGYLAYVAGTSKYIQDIHPEDVYWCMADIGWITGHSYIVYGPLAIAATSVIYEGVPTYPDAGRAHGGSPSGSTSTSFIPHPRPSGCCAKPAQTSRPNTTIISNT
jgi:acetyl-CoA synthetase